MRRTSYTYRGTGWGRSTHGETVPVLRPEEIRQLPPGRALVVAENAPPLIARLDRCLTGRRGAELLTAQSAARDRVAAARDETAPPAERAALAHEAAAHAGLAPTGQDSR